MKQEIFETATLGVLKQGGPSLLPNQQFVSSCCYDNGNGRRCAAGHVLPSDLHIEGMLVGEISAEFVALHDYYTKDEIDFLENLQLVHDQHHDSQHDYVEQSKKLCESENLDFKPIREWLEQNPNSESEWKIFND